MKMKSILNEWRKAKKALREQAGKEPPAEELVVAEVERDKKFKFPEPLRTNIKSVLAKSKPSYLKAKKWVTAKADQVLAEKGGKGKGSGAGPGKRYNVTVRNGKCFAKGKSLGDVSGAQATPADFAKCKADNKRRGMTINCRSAARAAAQNRACAALANKT